MSRVRAQNLNCVVSGGTNFGTIIQNCAPTPQVVTFDPPPGQPLVPIQDNGRFIYRLLARVIGPTDIRVIGCGEDLTDLWGARDQPEW